VALTTHLFLENELTRGISATTFETADRATAPKFDVYDNAPINIVIEVKQPRRQPREVAG
jgi:hypothetical protein